ncbi:MAG: 50S ribosomal protein L35 [Proteobacteria bacterium]|nr:50S ribosomal protein L35 [Pseudomonadota bacterium]
MPKLKTNSSAKKRFKVTGSGKVKYKQVGKRHGMTKRSNKQIRQLRKSSTLSESIVGNVLKHLMPYNN